MTSDDALREGHVPTAEDVRSAYVYAEGSGDPDWTNDKAVAEFDRWLARVEQEAYRRGQADGWDEGYASYRRWRSTTGSEPAAHQNGRCPWCGATFPVDSLRDQHQETCEMRPRGDEKP